MRPPRLEACYFAGPDRLSKWDRLARVLAMSAAEQCPGWQRHVEALPPLVLDGDATRRTFACNTRKLDRWRDIVLQADEGEQILLIDADTVMLRPLDDVWRLDFDVAYTTKSIPRDQRRPMQNTDRFPFNGGVLFLRISPAVKAFISAWADENRLMLADKDRHRPWLYRCGGINQASMGKLLTSGAAADLQVRELPCEEWNCEDSTWASFDPARTRIVHVKSDLRRACFHPYARTPELATLTRLWQACDRIATPLPLEVSA